MNRRDFIAALGGVTAAWSFPAGAEKAGRIRRIAALWPFGEQDSDGQGVLTAFREGLRDLGWADIPIESRWSGGNIERTRAFAAELVGLSPDVIFAYFNAQLGPLSRETRTIPIVFVGASDPVGAGYVASLARPGGNITGFTLYEPTLAGKWLGVLKEAAPQITRSAGVEPVIANVYSPSDIETAIASLGNQPGSGLIVAPDTFSEVNGDLFVALAARHRVPTVYAISRYATRGGLMSYGPNTRDAVRRAASYVDRILRGEKPADLPVQAPVKFDLVVNLKAAKALGLNIPEAFLLRADDVIE
jgi:putative ABC transport system substrate-binding protein